MYIVSVHGVSENNKEEIYISHYISIFINKV